MLPVMKYGKVLKRFASNLSGFAVGDSNQSFHYKEMTIFFKIALGTRLLVVRTCLIMISDYVQARRNRGWEGGVAAEKVDLLPIDSYSEKEN